ncbi:MAG: Hpt domain-containing protein, partial [Lachnospiraceae bacterium]|nr:Hpt domain-containing protein [Lachnospiraceae bacterium]
DSVRSEDRSLLEKLDGSGKLDVWQGIENNGTLENYISMLGLFCATVTEKADEIETLYDSGNLKDYTIKIHAMKSSLRIIGAHDLGERAQELENAGNNKDLACIDQNLRTFMEACVKLSENISGILSEKEEQEKTRSGSGYDAAKEQERTGSGYDAVQEETGSGSGRKADENFLNDAFYRLNRAARDMDIDVIEEILKELEGYELPDRVEAKVKKLKKACLQFDYDTVKELAKSLY